MMELKRRTRPPLVFLHGWGMTAHVWQPLIDRIDVETHVIAPDLPGHGPGDTRVPAGLHNAVDMISADAPRRCVVIGWSLGATVALAWALARPDDVDRLILIGATPCFVQRADWPTGVSPGDFSGFERGMTKDTPATLRRFCALQVKGDARGKGAARELATSTSAEASSRLSWGLDVLRDTDLRRDLEQIAQRVLIIHGENDTLVPVEAAHFMAGAMRMATLNVLSGASHAPLISAPDIVAAGIREFVDG